MVGNRGRRLKDDFALKRFLKFKDLEEKIIGKKKKKKKKRRACDYGGKVDAVRSGKFDLY